jgi:hypothetical protein
MDRGRKGILLFELLVQATSVGGRKQLRAALRCKQAFRCPSTRRARAKIGGEVVGVGTVLR